MGDGIGFAEAPLGMPGIKITGVDELDHGQLVVGVETIEVFDCCRTCGVRAEAQTAQSHPTPSNRRTHRERNPPSHRRLTRPKPQAPKTPPNRRADHEPAGTDPAKILDAMKGEALLFA